MAEVKRRISPKKIIGGIGLVLILLFIFIGLPALTYGPSVLLEAIGILFFSSAVAALIVYFINLLVKE